MTIKHRLAAATIYVVSCVPSFTLQAQTNTEPDPWFTEERNPQESEATTDESDETIVLRKTRPAALIKKLRKELSAVPESNLNRRISLLQEIVSTSSPNEDDLQLLAGLESKRREALEAILSASSDTMPLEAAIERLAPYAKFYRGDSTLVVKLLDSEFASRLTHRVSSLGRLNMVAELTKIESKLNEAGLAPLFGTQVKRSVSGATATMIARKWEELTSGQTTLPAEAYLIGQLFDQPDQKLSLSIEVPNQADPILTESISKSIQRRWGEDFELTDTQDRGVTPELILKIDLKSIQSSYTTSETSKQSMIPGAVIEEPNPDFLALVEKYEKAYKAYESQMETYTSLYENYLNQLDDREYREAQDNLRTAEQILENTPFPNGAGPSTEYDAAVAQVEFAKSMANSISAPMAIEPQKPHPTHLKILDDLYLVPSTIIISEEKTPYEYTTQELTYRFETKAPITLESPVTEQLKLNSTVSLGQNRKWTQNLGVDPRDPTANDGTYSHREYESALNLFGLEFGSSCAQELAKMFESAKATLEGHGDKLDLRQALLFLALKNITSPSSMPELDEKELGDLAELATQQQISASQFRAHCLAKLLSKAGFAHLADEEKISQIL